ncbi:hypothetical protein VUN82_09345 [Micrococcaceae bacterium Sec5.1]
MITETMNEAMRPLRGMAQPRSETSYLDPRIKAELDEGLTIREGCLFFVSQIHNIRQNSDADFGGPTGFEGYINKLPLDWLIDGADDSPAWRDFAGTSDWVAGCLTQGILLGHLVIAAAAELTDNPIDVWIHVDYGHDEENPSASFRFVTYREEDLWASNLDGFEQPVLRMTSGNKIKSVGT